MRLIVVGAAGRMGRTLVRLIGETEGLTLAGALEHASSPALGSDAGVLACGIACGVTITDDPLPLVVEAEGVVDFSTPATSLALAALAAQARIVHVIGTTGFTVEDDAKLQAAARHATIIKSGNMSLGVNLLADLARRAAAALGPEWDAEIVEMHHRAKVDAPSGTALLLGAAVADGRHIDLRGNAVRGRDGVTGARPPGSIGFASLRGGTVVGDHRIILAGDGERIELVHYAEDRTIFARGALKAAAWGRGRKPGLFSMADVIGASE